MKKQKKKNMKTRTKCGEVDIIVRSREVVQKQKKYEDIDKL